MNGGIRLADGSALERTQVTIPGLKLPVKCEPARVRIKHGWVDAGRCGWLYCTLLVYDSVDGKQIARHPLSMVCFDGESDIVLFKAAGWEASS